MRKALVGVLSILYNLGMLCTFLLSMPNNAAQHNDIDLRADSRGEREC